MKKYCLFAVLCDIWQVCFVSLFMIWQIGIIGGSGLDNPELLDNRQEKEVTTVYGKVYLLFMFSP